MKANNVRTIELGNMPKYDTYLLDVWGVIYDGQNLLKTGVELLDELMSYGKVILLSNTSRTAEELTQMLESKGMDTSKLSGVITSGMMAQQAIKGFIKQYNSKTFYHVGSIEPSRWLHDLPTKVNDSICTSDIVICSNLLTETKENLMFLTRKIKKQSLPVFITNPDKKVYIDGEIYMSAGVMIEHCKRNDIEVSVFGKPEPSIFIHALEHAGANTQNVCMIGDSYETDILGANQCGIDSILVQGEHSVSKTESFSQQNQPTYRVFL
ncbi:TIGR01459 family HAD-type hydrolase [Vibrio crassostreae]|uniref:TIGR01459 family HAD-type hydrolase n=1 Tax=Vibrio crassostreae TaxID=246167 RepID=UPI000F464A02|nr:TIGR01459 family HAD-type hydrolase [Vibrio crassostreae]ROO77063.1 HAD superfamily hydrolase (TIGR01459 family) [Vibrio crassostreae]ROR75366.1 HAD superfamily hydrolase (TIGR01459 family) [Vibrio crassostreae]TCV32815.1 HAD superfamily hydrolase (TIGR01459 family) [Vibrio crassostreae]